MALTLCLALGAWESQPADAGLPEITLISSDAPTVSMLVSFGTGYGDDHALTGLTAQAQVALTQANAALPIQRWNELAFGSNLKLVLAQGRYQTHFMLSAPSESFEEAARMLLPALLSPRLDEGGFSRLAAEGDPRGRAASDAEIIMQVLEPLVLDEKHETQSGKVMWQDFSRVQQVIAESFTPGNATITVVGGFDPERVRPLLTKVRRGKPRAYVRSTTVSDVHKKIASELSVHLFGYPLPQLSASDTAGVRVISRRLSEQLMVSLRQEGVAYSITVEPQLTPWFDGVFMMIPAFDSTGADLEPFIIDNLGRAIHEKLDAPGLTHLVEAVQTQDTLALEQPDSFILDIVQGKKRAVWLSPEYRAALAALKTEEVTRASNAYFVNERRRFYVHFNPETRKPPPSSQPGRRRP